MCECLALYKLTQRLRFCVHNSYTPLILAVKKKQQHPVNGFHGALPVCEEGGCAIKLMF